MNQFTTKRPIEKGQVLILVVLMMFAMIAMAALILDGGSIMSNRRTAQAAADAGALAGAQYLCGGMSDPEAIAETYALKNGANDADATINGMEITVVASIENESFFAKIFNEDNLLATANATAGCFYPSIAKRVLPLSFYYESPPIDADLANCNNDGTCNLVNWDFEELMTKLSTTPVANIVSGEVNHPFDDIYVISNSIKVCEKDVTGAVVCVDMSLNAGGGARTFIDLTAIKDPPANLSNIIQDGVDEPLHVPSWVNVQDGVSADVYNETNYSDFDPITGYEGLEARLFFVPVFKQFCEQDPEVNCSTDPGDIFDYLVNVNQPSYRLVGFAPFVVTGVTKNGTCQFGAEIPVGDWTLDGQPITIENNKEECPGYATLRLQLESEGEVISKDAIEGYFVDEISADQFVWGTGGVDVGIYLISLID